MHILDNAISAIQIGLEDYNNSDPRRSHSSIRNIFAGLLLLFKEKLFRLSPDNSDDILIKQNITPKLDNNGDLHFVGSGKKTVDVYEIKKRFNEFNIKVNWKDFDNINSLRNDIEHYYTELTPQVINEIVSKSFKIISDFCEDYLEEDPKEILGTDAWNILLESKELYQKEKELCLHEISKINWEFDTLKKATEYFRCNDCESDLVYPIDNKDYKTSEGFLLGCKSCDNEFDVEDVIEECINKELAGEHFSSVSSGGESPYENCPECNLNTFIYNEDCCINCGYSHTFEECYRCGEQLNLEEAYNSKLCSYCDHMLEKMNEED